VLRERITAMDDAILVQLNAAGSGDELSWEPLAAVTAAGLQADNPDLRGRITGALQWARHLIGERAETAAHTGDSVFQPTRENPAVVVMIDEIDETGNIEGATKLLEFLASKQRKSAVILVLAGQRATVQWTGGSGVRVNLSTVVYGMLARDSEARHAVGAENELPDISEYSRGQAGYFGIYSVRAKKLTQRGRTFYIGTLRDQQEKIIARRDPADRPTLKGAGEVAASAPAAPREQPGSALRERLAKVQAQNQERPQEYSRMPLPAVPGVPPEIMAGIVGALSGEALSAASIGLRLGISKSAAKRYMALVHGAGIVLKINHGRASRWQLVQQEPVPEPVPGPAPRGQEPYTPLEALIQLVHDGMIPADDEQREICEQAWQLMHGRPKLTVIQGGNGQ
jgi:hypothetical protein